MSSQIMERIELEEGYSLTRLAAPQAFFNKTLEELDVRKKHRITIAAIHRSPEPVNGEAEEGRRRGRLIKVPLPESKILPGDILVVIGSDDAVDALATL
jgi:trk system potassium uptake protein TrkA